MPPRRGGVSPRPKIVIDWSVWYRDCDGVGTYQRAPPHLPKWPRRLTRASSMQSITSNPGHVLSRFLPRVKSTGYNLRPRAHAYELPKKDNRNFMSRVLYSDIY